jgi:phosphoribosylanthranilate isomerase
LLDACVPHQYGGTGRLADWTLAREYQTAVGDPPLVLAGGLTPHNVGEAIRATGAAAVDTASGVESRPGRKDPAAVAAFVREARKEFSLGRH